MEFQNANSEPSKNHSVSLRRRGKTAPALVRLLDLEGRIVALEQQAAAAAAENQRLAARLEVVETDFIVALVERDAAREAMLSLDVYVANAQAAIREALAGLVDQYGTRIVELERTLAAILGRRSGGIVQ